MKNKIKKCLLGMAVVGVGAASVFPGVASTPKGEPNFQKSFQWYVGLSGGGESIWGKRNESVFNPAANETITFTSNFGFNDKNAQYSGFAGLSIPVLQTNFLFEPEIFIGRGHSEKGMTKFVLDIPTGTSRTLESTISSSAFYGAVLKVGYKFFRDYVGFVSFGAEKHRFKNSITYVPQSNLGLGIGPDFAPGFNKAQKWLNGFVLGFGVEKHIKCFRVGADIRFIDYGRFKTNYYYEPSNESISNSFKIRSARFSLRASYLF